MRNTSRKGFIFLAAMFWTMSIGYGQVDFEIFPTDPNIATTVRASTVVEDGYLFFGLQDTFLILLKIDDEGNMIDSAQFGKKNRIFVLDDVFETDSSYLFTATVSNNVDTFPSFWVGEFTKQLVFQKEQTYPLPWEKDVNYIHYYWELESDTVLFATGYLYGWLNLATKEVYYYNNQPSIEWTNILPRRDSSGYLLTGWGLMYLDDSLNEIKINPFALATIGASMAGINAEYINDSTLFMATPYKCLGTKEFVNAGDVGVFVGVMDKGLNLIYHDTLDMGEPDDTAWGMYYARQKILARSSDSTFVVGGATFPYSYNYSRIYCAKYNSKAERIWGGILYTEEDYEYFLHSVLATPDGGCLISGKRIKDFYYHYYILKIGPDGLLTSEISVPLGQAPVKVYPNPTSDIIRFDLADMDSRLDFELVDMSGRVVLRQKINGSAEISTSHLPKGIYAYRLLNRKGEIIYTGKMVKE